MNSPAPKRVVLTHSDRAVPANATHIGRTDPNQIISVSVIVKRKNPLDLRALGGQRVSREDFDAQFAADPASFEALRTFAHENGLAVDEAASIDVLCADKTGTLTRNELTVTTVHPLAGFDEARVLGLAALASSDGGQDPVDAAIRSAAAHNIPSDLPKRISFVPFDPATSRTPGTGAAR